MEWFYSDLLGIAQADDSIGFEKVMIRPTPVGDVTWAKGSHLSSRGKISVSWKKEQDQLTTDITIPPNISAIVSLPTESADQVQESGSAVSKRNDIKPVGVKAGRSLFEVGSGEYHFSSPMKADSTH